MLTTDAVGRDGEAVIAPTVPGALRRDDGHKPGGSRRRPPADATTGSAKGSRTKAAPPPGSLPTSSAPPRAWTREATMARPRPVPPPLRARSGVAAPAGIRPLPVSRPAALDSRVDIRRPPTRRRDAGCTIAFSVRRRVRPRRASGNVALSKRLTASARLTVVGSRWYGDRTVPRGGAPGVGGGAAQRGSDGSAPEQTGKGTAR